MLLVCIVGFSLLAAIERSSSLRRYAESRNCANQMLAVCSGAKLWADGHGGRFPTSFLSASNELVTDRVLICPADAMRLRADSGHALAFTNVTYELISPGIDVADTNTVFIRCPIHGHMGYTDATVFDGIRRRGKLP